LDAPVRARGELQADLAAGRVAGRDAVLTLLDATLSAVTIETALTRGAASRADLAVTVADAMAGLTESMMAARPASEAGMAARVDLSHPGTHLRRQLLEQASDAGVLVLLDPADAAASSRSCATARRRRCRKPRTACGTCPW
jgi:hypothetical protein